MTSKLKALGDCWSHHLQGRGRIAVAPLQAAQLVTFVLYQPILPKPLQVVMGHPICWRHPLGNVATEHTTGCMSFLLPNDKHQSTEDQCRVIMIT